jgi:hypothetical protein
MQIGEIFPCCTSTNSLLWERLFVDVSILSFILAQCIWKSELQDNTIASNQFWIKFTMYGKPSVHNTVWSGPYTCIIQYDSKKEFPGKVSSSSLCRTAMKWMELFMPYTRMDTGDIKLSHIKEIWLFNSSTAKDSILLEWLVKSYWRFKRSWYHNIQSEAVQASFTPLTVRTYF